MIKSHQVTVGNFSIEAAPGGGSMIRVSAIVDNVSVWPFEIVIIC